MKQYLFFALCILSLVSSAQQEPAVVNFKTPEAAAFDKYIETPVSYYTGVPEISIPLYTVTIKGVSVPISLSYHAGGIRVDEEATWVGLGWSLSYGGQISRKVRGQPDEQAYFRTTESDFQYGSIAYFLQLPDRATDPNTLERRSRMYACKQQQPNAGDYMPDEFYYNILGHSGRFMFNQGNRKFVFYPKDDIGLDYDVSNLNSGGFPTSSYHIQDWNMTLPDGVKVKFGQDGFSEQKNDAQLFYQRSAWTVKSISNNSNESINFSYQPFSYSSVKLSGEVFSARTQSYSTTVATEQYHDANIQQIGFPGGYVIFKTMPRDDMPNQALQEMDVYDYNGTLIKKISFLYSYFAGSYGSAPALSYISSNYTDKRLRLDKVVIWNSGVEPQVYAFDYYAGDSPSDILNQPSKISYSQDYWGYFNGIRNGTMVPYLSSVQQRSGGGDRNAYNNYNVFALKTITYPTGGKSEYIYEGNTANASGAGSVFLPSIKYPGTSTTTAYVEALGPDRLTFMEYPPDNTDANGTSTFTKTFTIGDDAVTGSTEAVPVTVFYQTNFGNTGIDAQELGCPQNVQFKLEKIETNGTKTQVMNIFGRDCADNLSAFTMGSGKNSYSLLKGSYLLTLVISYPYSIIHESYPDNYKQAHTTYITAQWVVRNPGSPAPPAQDYVDVGGYRIKNINLYDADGSVALKKQYSYLAPDGISTSGNVISWPKVFQFYYQVDYEPSSFTPESPYFYYDNADLRFFGNSVTPLETTSGSYVGYQYVTEQTVGTRTPDVLTTKYSFSFVQPIYDQNYSVTHEGVVDAQEWKQGKLLSAQYLKNGNPVKQELYQYNQFSPHLSSSQDEDYVDEINQDFISYQVTQPPNVAGPTVEGFYDPLNPGFDPVPIGLLKFYFPNNDANIHYNYGVSQLPSDKIGAFPYFKRFTGFDKLQTKTTITYDDAGNKLTETESYFYEKTPVLNQLTKSQSTNSKGDLLTRSLQYPVDFSAVAPYSTMLQRNMVNPVIVQTDMKNSIFLQSSKTNYQDWGNNIIAPFSMEVKVGSNASEIRTQYYGYDNVGNPLTVAKPNDVLQTYLWGYNNQYPVAKVIGADYNTALSFVNQSILQNPSGDQQVRDEINKIRIGLAGSSAQVYSYTYKPLVGISSQTDQSNKSTYYEYDPLGRLNVIRDLNNNIIKKIDYHSSGSKAVQIFYSDPQSVTFSRSNCAGNEIGSAYTSSLPANAYNSLVNRDDANHQALFYLNSVGPANANTYGTCTVDPNAISLPYICSRVYPFTFSFTNTVTGANYAFTINAASGNMGQIAPGTYNLTVTCPALNGSTFGLIFGNSSLSGASISLSNVSITSSPRIETF